MKTYCFDDWKDAKIIKETLSKEKCDLLHDILTNCEYIDNRPENFEWYSDKNYGCDRWLDLYEKGYMQIKAPEKYQSLEPIWIYTILMVRDGNESLEYLFWSIDDVFDALENEQRESISDYFEFHLKDFELEGVEMTEDDVEWVMNKMKSGMSMEEACDECLQGVYDCLDIGLDYFEEIE